MATTVDLGFFSRAGASTAGRIGKLRGLWDRHHGGAVTLDSTNFSGGPIAVAARVRLNAGGRELLLRQEDDPDPRLIVCEQGPERIWMRVMWSLLDGKGKYLGDGLTETILYADGEVRLAFGLRLVGAGKARVRDAWIETRLAGPLTGGQVGTKKPSTFPLKASRAWTFKRQLKGQYVAAAAKRGGVAVGFYSLDGRPIDKLGTGVGIYWSEQGDRAPWYDTWGHLYGQWNGHSGWGAFDGGRLVSEPVEKGLSLQWKWLNEADEPAGEVFGLRAMLGLFFDTSADAAVARVKHFQDPVLPKVLGGLELRCLDLVENTLLYRAAPVGHAHPMMKFAVDKQKRIVRVRLLNCCHTAATVNGRPQALQQHTLGGQTDDPYGPNLARAGDRFMPLVGDDADPASESVGSFQLSADKPAEVEFHSYDPALSYVKWDDREVYAVRGIMAEKPTALFSTRTLCLHDVRSDGQGEMPALVRVPLYWYPTNVATRGQCSNEPRRIRRGGVLGNEMTLMVESATPDGRLLSSVSAAVSCWPNTTSVEVSSRLKIQRACDLDEMQFLNAFPYNSWRTADWETDWIVTMDAEGGETTYFVKEPRGKSVVGDQKQHWKKAFFFAQGARDRGNVFLLARMPGGRAAGRQVGRYVLCRCWLDSHFSLDKLKLARGAKFAVDYTLAIAGDKRLSRAEAQEIGRRSLKAGQLELE